MDYQKAYRRVRELWDVDGIITCNDNPMELWKDYVEVFSDGLTLNDFENCVIYLREITKETLGYVFSVITGYEHGKDYSSAKNDGYYECNTVKDKLKYINDLCMADDNIAYVLPFMYRVRLIKFIDKEHDGVDGWHNDYEELINI